MAVETYFNAEMVWCAENDKYASKLIQERFDKPNLGDIKQIDWASVEPIDILTAGYPCQPFSHAGQRKGDNDERHIWPHILKGISILRPKYIVLENVRGHLSLGFKKFSATLPKMGMMQDGVLFELVMSVLPIKEQDYSLLPTPMARDYKGKSTRNIQLPNAVSLLPTPTAMHVRNHDESIEKYRQRVEDFNQGKTLGKPGASTGVAVRLIATPTTNISHTTGKCRDWGADLLHDVKCLCRPYRIHWSMEN